MFLTPIVEEWVDDRDRFIVKGGSVTIFLLSHLHMFSSRWKAVSPLHFIVSIDSAVCFIFMLLLLHACYLHFDACISYMLLTCSSFTYLLHAMQAWLTRI